MSNVVYRGHIESNFSGLEGNSIWKLTDGSVWEQAVYKYRYHYAYRPKVELRQKGGRYLLWIEAMDEEIEVRRL